MKRTNKTGIAIVLFIIGLFSVSFGIAYLIKPETFENNRTNIENYNQIQNDFIIINTVR